MEEVFYDAPPSEDGTDRLRLPPQSALAEAHLIGGLLIDNSAWDRIADQINDHDFYRKEHRVIYAIAASLLENQQPADAVTVIESLTHKGELDDAGGDQYVKDLANETPSSANIEAYAEIVRAHSLRRQLISAGSEIASSVFEDSSRKIAELVDAAEAKVFKIAEAAQQGESIFRSLPRVLSNVVDRIDELYNSDTPISGLATGFDDFDERTTGLQPGDLIIVAGRPAMGKTSFAMNIAENVVVGSGKPVAVFSMEMPAEQLVMRMLASLGRINQQNLRTGQLNDDDWARITSGMGLLKNAPLYVDDSAGLSPIEIRARARRLKREHDDLGLIVIDYLQLMQSPNHADNRTAEISEISRSLKALAKELSVPVIALSQLNRNLEQRPNKRPVMSDLRESGSIEQDADIVTFIYRDEVYNPESKEAGTAEIIIGKQRNGPIGMVRLTFLGQYTRFENFAPEMYGDDYGME